MAPDRLGAHERNDFSKPSLRFTIHRKVLNSLRYLVFLNQQSSTNLGTAVKGFCKSIDVKYGSYLLALIVRHDLVTKHQKNGDYLGA